MGGRFREETEDGMSSGSSSDAECVTTDACATTTEEKVNILRGKKRLTRASRRELERIHFQMVNERVVEDITLEALYKPHTLTVLIAFTFFILYKAFTGDKNQWTGRNVYEGLLGTLGLFIVVSALAFPNGPFIRPHPIIWRITFGISVAYMLVLQFTLFQTHSDIKKVLSWLDPAGLSHERLVEKEYANECWDITFQKFMSNVDFFAFAHFTGWIMKALLIRHGVLCWYISIAWEVTELVFMHVLPNFAECWWDAIVLDILLCNGLGIYVGLKLSQFFQIRQYHWESIRNIKSQSGRIKRLVMQFTPESWNNLEWYNISSVVRRTMAIWLFVLIFLLTELNTFFLKHIFAVDTQHPVVFSRLCLIGIIAAPSIRQYYVYVTDPLVTRLGMQCWVFCAVCLLEAAVCVKSSVSTFSQLEIRKLFAWIAILIIGTFFSVWLSVWLAQKNSENRGKVVDKEGESKKFYMDSSYENLGAIHDDVQQRRKDLGLFQGSDVN